MKFNQLEKYNKELTEMEKTLQEMEEFLEKNPEEFGTLENYKTYKYVYNIFKEDKILFLKEMN